MVNTLRLKKNGHHFTDGMYKCMFLNVNVRISINISLNFVPYDPIDYKSALVQIMAWREASNKPLSEPMMTYLLTHICITQPKWVNSWKTTNTTPSWASMGCLWRECWRLWNKVICCKPSSLPLDDWHICEFNACSLQSTTQQVQVLITLVSIHNAPSPWFFIFLLIPV